MKILMEKNVTKARKKRNAQDVVAIKHIWYYELAK
jgi:hypothetical protein